MSKIIVIPDVHGRDTWELIKDMEWDEAIFIGDYFDSFDIDTKVQQSNFKNIVDFKNNSGRKVTLLTGNHDLQYITDQPCSGYQDWSAFAIKNLLMPLYESNELNMVRVVGNYLFSHAGVSKTWCYNNRINTDIIEDSINNLYHRTPSLFNFTFPERERHISERSISYYGDNVWQTPVWIRPESLVRDKVDGFIQVVGHTKHSDLTLRDNVWFIDCHESKKVFLTLENVQ